jgi:hypothetical protein
VCRGTVDPICPPARPRTGVRQHPRRSAPRAAHGGHRVRTGMKLLLPEHPQRPDTFSKQGLDWTCSSLVYRGERISAGGLSGAKAGR